MKKTITIKTKLTCLILAVVFIEITLMIFVWNFFEQILIFYLLIAMVFGLIVMFICLNIIAFPLKKLADDVKKGLPYQVLKLEKSSIKEINDLSNSLEKLSSNVVQYSQQLTSAIGLFSLGIFFYSEDSSSVYCTQPFFDICGIDKKEGCIDRQEFLKLYKMITDCPYDSNLSAFQLNDSTWVRIKSKQENNFNLGILTNVTKQINKMREVERERDIDPLTNLYNRAAFNKAAQEFFVEPKNIVIAIIMWDIDKLKYINDAYGHAAGDRYICKLAEVIKSLEEYGGIVSRRSGDEFLGLLYGETHSDIIKIINELQTKIDTAGVIMGDNIFEKLRVSTGIAWYPDDGNNLKNLINYADFALYEVKYNVRGVTNNYNKNAFPQFSYLLHYGEELDRIFEGEFVNFAYQPIVDAKTGIIFGYEFLMRIYNENINSPKKLNTISRLHSKLHLVEDLTFTKGFEANDENISRLKGYKIFLNSISNIILCDKTIRQILHKQPNNLDMLVVELIDCEFSEVEIINNKIEMLRNLNAEIAIDNFGRNVDNFDIKYAVDYIKIDMSIIDKIDVDKPHQETLKQILLYAEGRNIKTIAVGVKNYEEMKYLIKAGVDYIQGYYLAMPSSKPCDISANVIKQIREISQID